LTAGCRDFADGATGTVHHQRAVGLGEGNVVAADAGMVFPLEGHQVTAPIQHQHGHGSQLALARLGQGGLDDLGRLRQGHAPDGRHGHAAVIRRGGGVGRQQQDAAGDRLQCSHDSTLPKGEHRRRRERRPSHAPVYPKLLILGSWGHRRL